MSEEHINVGGGKRTLVTQMGDTWDKTNRTNQEQETQKGLTSTEIKKTKINGKETEYDY